MTTPLHLAVEKNDETLVKLLLKNDADVDIQDGVGDTPLHVSAHRKIFGISQLLIESGCNINLSNFIGRTPLDLAFSGRNETLVKMLLKMTREGLYTKEIYYCTNLLGLRVNIATQREH